MTVRPAAPAIDVRRRVRADLLSSALERLGLAGRSLLVLGVALDGRDDSDSAAAVHDRQRLGVEVLVRCRPGCPPGRA
jgi:hypothetical protein